MADKNPAIHVDPQKHGLESSPIIKGDSEKDLSVVDSHGTCTWNGVAYSTGAEICIAGSLHHCNGVQWVDFNKPC
jgi:hypothetical protein